MPVRLTPHTPGPLQRVRQSRAEVLERREHRESLGLDSGEVPHLSALPLGEESDSERQSRVEGLLALASSSSDLHATAQALGERNQRVRTLSIELAQMEAHTQELLAILELKEDEIRRLNRSLSKGNIQTARMLAERDLQRAEWQRMEQSLQVEATARREWMQRSQRAERELRRLERTLAEVPKEDPLTGGLSRWGLECAFAKLCGEVPRVHSHLSLLVVSIAPMASLLESREAVVGDLVLREVSRMTGKILRDSDPLGRLDAHTFLALLPGASLPVLQAISRRLEGALEERTLALPQGEIPVSACAAVALVSPALSSLGEILDALSGTSSIYETMRSQGPVLSLG